MAAVALAAAAGVAGAGCGFDQEGVPPPTDRIYFPGAILIDPVYPWLYVLNSNADLRYNDGTLVAVDLDAVAADRQTGSTPRPPCPEVGYIAPSSSPEDYCCWDRLDRNILNCDERQYITDRTTVRIGSFGSAMVFQLHDPAWIMETPGRADRARERRIMAAIRGNSSLTWIDVTADPTSVAFVCSTPPGGEFGSCDQSHQLKPAHHVLGAGLGEGVTSQVDIPLPEEPYTLAIDSNVTLEPLNDMTGNREQKQADFLYIGHLKLGYLSLVDASGYDFDGLPPDPSFTAPFPSMFPGDTNGNQGVTSLTVDNDEPGDAPDGTAKRKAVYVTSRYVPLAGVFRPSVNGQVLDYQGVPFNTRTAGAETRGIQIIRYPENDALSRAFVLQRSPPALIGFNLKDNTPTAPIETCSGPTFLYKHEIRKGDLSTLQLFVTCFDAGEIDVFDPWLPRRVAVIDVGRGPAGMVFAPPDPATGMSTRAYVNGFGANNVSVIDLEPGSPTRYHVIQRIGFPSATPR